MDIIQRIGPLVRPSSSLRLGDVSLEGAQVGVMTGFVAV